MADDTGAGTMGSLGGTGVARSTTNQALPGLIGFHFC
jgi:hypothetical protein